MVQAFLFFTEIQLFSLKKFSAEWWEFWVNFWNFRKVNLDSFCKCSHCIYREADFWGPNCHSESHCTLRAFHNFIFFTFPRGHGTSAEPVNSWRWEFAHLLEVIFPMTGWFLSWMSILKYLNHYRYSEGLGLVQRLSSCFFPTKT